MEENIFEIRVVYKGQEMIFQAQLLDFGYIRKIKIEVNCQEVFIEKDDEGNYRAILADIKDESTVDKNLVKQIVKSKYIICSVPESRKAIAVKNTVEQPVSNLYPASILQSHPACFFYLDQSSAALLSAYTNA